MDEPVKVMLVEDNREYRKVISLTLEKSPGINLTEQYGNAERALRQLEDGVGEAPDIILLDLSLPGMSGMEAIPHLRKACPDTRILMLTQSDRESDVIRAISLGASGYLLKSALVDEIVDSIHSVMGGGAPIDAGVARYILENLQARLPEVSLDIHLSRRELEILNLLGEGLVKKEIADKLSIGYTTVDTHVRHIYEKMHVSNAPAAVAKAYKLGIFTARKKKDK